MLYRTPNVMIPYGNDFAYENANIMINNSQKLFDYINLNKKWKISVKFGTLSDYFNAILNITSNYEIKKVSIQNNNSFFPIITGDFLHYADKDEDYWTGYYTSRPFFKGLLRKTESILRTVEILHSFVISKNDTIKNEKDYYSIIELARRSISLFQHHVRYLLF